MKSRQILLQIIANLNVIFLPIVKIVNVSGLPFQVQFRFGFGSKSDWEDVAGGDSEDKVEDKLVAKFNLKSHWAEDKVQLDLLLAEHQTEQEKAPGTNDTNIKSVLGLNKGLLKLHL